MHGRVDIQVGTLSKAIGALGGYVAGSRSLIEFLYHRARPFLFSTSHPPSVAAACLAALDVLLEEPEIIERLWENTRFFKAGLQALGFNTGISESPITPVIVGDGALAMKLSDRLFAEGVFAQGIAFPTVAARQGARPDHRHRHPHARRPAVRARRVQARRRASSGSSDGPQGAPVPDDRGSRRHRRGARRGGGRPGRPGHRSPEGHARRGTSSRPTRAI